MKRVIVLLFMLTATACNNVVFDETLLVPYGTSPATPALLPTNYPCKLSNHRITKDHACELISNFLKIKNLYDKAKKYAIGGYMDKSGLSSVTEDSTVIQFFPSYQENPFYKKDEVYLCYKETKHYSNGNSNTIEGNLSDSEILEQSTDPLYYTKGVSNVSPSDVADFISTIKEKELPTSQDHIEGLNVKKYTKKFFKEYHVGGVDPNPKYHWGAFDKCQVMALLNQTDSIDTVYHCTGIHYYFGYDSTRVNKLRIILVGVMKTTSLVVSYSNLIKYNTGEEALMFEKEWPPDW